MGLMDPPNDVLNIEGRTSTLVEKLKEMRHDEYRPGYHLDKIEKGVIGESSKIREELDELIDAEKQGVRVMQLVELSDLIGAVEAYLENNFPGINLEDLRMMSAVTRRAFRNGKR